MDKTVVQLLEIIDLALKGKKYDQPVEEGEKLFKIARDSGLSGMVYVALPPSTNSVILKRFQADFYRYNARDVRQLAVIDILNQLFNANEINHVFLKGSELKLIYPESFMRSMGDIDVLVSPEGMPRIRPLMESIGFRFFSEGENHTVFLKGEDIIVEVHHRVDANLPPQWQPLMKEIWQHTVLITDHRYALEPAFNLVFLLCHLGKHFASSGVGLRSILDIGLFSAKYQSSMDQDHLNKYLSMTGLAHFYRKILWLNDRLFHVNPCPSIVDAVVPDEKFLEDVTAFVISSGMHGKAEDFNTGSVGISALARQKNSVAKGRIAYFFKVIFPSRLSMSFSYPYLEKNGWLLPIAWISRWFVLLFKKTKHSLLRLRQLNVSKRQIEEQAEIFRKLGL